MSNESGRLESEYAQGVRAAIQNNLFAYGYSLTVTGSLAMLSTRSGTPSVAEVFLFLVGAVSAFTLAEALVSKGFSLTQERGESAEVVALGSAFGYFSAGTGVGMAALVTVVLSGAIVWPLGALFATAGYVTANGVELAVADHLQKRKG